MPGKKGSAERSAGSSAPTNRLRKQDNSAPLSSKRRVKTLGSGREEDFPSEREARLREEGRTRGELQESSATVLHSYLKSQN